MANPLEQSFTHILPNPSIPSRTIGSVVRWLSLKIRATFITYHHFNIEESFMQTLFSKYHGTGNDFIMVDNRANNLLRHHPELYALLCNRRFGIGADGVILLQNSPGYDFEMVYYNSDGYEGSMCGNGGRCAVAFAKQVGIIEGNHTRFLAIDGVHEAHIEDTGIVSLLMQPVMEIKEKDGNYILNTGSPHFVRLITAFEEVDVFGEGAAIRFSPPFREEGINVNFVQLLNGFAKVATYERGVEDETYSCGTGVVASGIALAVRHKQLGNVNTEVHTKGGVLWVKFHNHDHRHFTDIWLQGPATFVFSGQIALDIP